MGWVRCAEIVGGYQKRYFGTLIPNIYIDNNSGAEVSYAGWSATDFLEVNGDSTVVVGTPSDAYNNYYNCFYDENKSYISYFSSSLRPIVIPQNARYVRFSSQTNSISPLSYFYYPSNKSKSIDPNIIFSNGEFLNTNIFNVVLSESGSSQLQIDEDGYLCVVGTPSTGITINLSNASIFTVVCDCECLDTEPTSYFQGGVCSSGSDPSTVINTGAGRVSYRDATVNRGNKIAFCYQLDNPANVLFIGGANLKIRSIFGFPNATIL